MDVTCERCKTGYEFDDALVSERGTSVRCTTCGHTFKVRRAGAAGPPGKDAPGTAKERWLVRTIDGRELEFRALRELQAAIAKGNVRRDDVLARENGRPRRLGSIAELDPFFTSRQAQPRDGTFSKTSIGVGPPRARAHTPPGLGDGTPDARPPMTSQLDESALRASDPGTSRASMPSVTSEGSVAIPLAAVMGKNNPGSRRSDRPGQAVRTPVPPVTVLHGETVGFEGSGPPDNEDVTHQVSRKELEAKIREAESLATSDSIAQSLPKPSTPPPAPEPARPQRPSLRERTPPADEASTQPQQARPAPPAPPKREILDATTVDEHPPFETETRKDDPGASGAHRGPASNGAPASSGARMPELPPAPSPEAAASAVPKGPEPTPTPTPSDTPDRGSIADMRASMASLVNLTPTPADVRYSYVGDHTRSSGDARFSGASESRRVGSARWIFALLLLGAVVVGGAVIGRHYFSKDGDKTAGDSSRLATLLADAEKAVGNGDLDTAKELVDRASGLAEKDPKVLRLSARIANERAELPWLELRFLAPDDSSRQAVKARLADQVGRARAAANRAAEAGKADPEILRERVDALRLAGDLPAARALVPQLAPTSTETRTQLVLAALDLAEDTPPLDEIIPRLTKVATDDEGGGRARLLLVYALGRKNDIDRAKKELAKLRASHPLKASAEAFLKRTGEGVAPSLDIESLPDAAPKGASSAEPGATGSGEVPADFRRALEQAGQAMAKGDQARAEQLYRGALAKEPGNPEALAGLGHVARARGDTKAATDYYKQSIAGSGNYLPALVPLADMLWDGGDRFLAQVYYKQIAQVAPPGPTLDRAKERAGSGGAPPPAAPPSAAAPEAPAPTADPAPIELLKPDPPPNEGNP